MACKRTDITPEICAELYKKYKNGIVVAEKLNCSPSTVCNRLKKAGIVPHKNNKYDRKLPKGKRQAPTIQRGNLKTKKEIAHYICTVLGEELADYLTKIRLDMMNKERG